MAIDIRATVVCSLGTLISGSLSDDYLQGSGLIKTRGTVEISGLITPAIGTVVTFTYTKNAVQRSIPRTMRVMSSFADPYRRTTKVELGCKLTYFSDLEEPLNWDALDDPENSTLTTADQEIVTVPIYAKSLAAECCTQIGLDPTPVSVLTNKFSIAEFDFSSGYVSILSDLLVSESYCGYLNASEELVLIDLSADGGTGPALTDAQIIDLGPIGTGQLPGEAVIVEYSTLKLQDPDGSVDAKDPVLLWELSEVREEVEYLLEWRPTGGALQSQIVRGVETTTTTSEYQRINGRDVLKQKVVDQIRLRAGVAGNAVQEWLALGGVPNSNPSLELPLKTITDYTYDESGNLTRQETTDYINTSVVIGKGGLGITYPDASYIFVGFEDPEIKERVEIVEIEPAGDVQLVDRYGYGRLSGTFYVEPQQKTTTYSYVLPHETIEGQQRQATAGDFMQTATEAAAYYNSSIDLGPVLDKVVVNTGEKLFSPETRPPAAELLNNALGQTVESEAEVVLALGSAEAQRRITFRMPYAPDDTFSGPTGGPFTATASDAEQKAITYGRVQNKLLLGNRNGMNIQVAPEDLPDAPFSPVYIQANGLTALYRSNGNQWAFSSDGIAASTDALFWGAVGGTGTFDISANPGVIWFPVSPTVTVLPAAPAVDGNGDITTTPAEVIPPYNEIVPVTLSVRTILEVTGLDYTLATEETVTLVTYTAVELGSGIIGIPAAVDFSLAALAPAMSTIVNVPTVAFTLSANAPDDVGVPPTLVQVPEAAFSLAAPAPAISTASVFVPVADFALAAYAPALPQPAPTYLSFGEQRRGTGALTFLDSTGIDAGTSIGDLAIIAVESSGGDSTLTTPSGWALFPGTNVVSTPDSTGTQLHVWWKRVDSLNYEQLTVPDGGDHQIATAIYVTGVVSSGDPWDAIVTDTDSTADTTCVWPSITTTRLNTLLVFVVAESTANQIATTPVNGNLTNLDIRRTYDGTIGDDGAVTFATGTWASAGASGTTSSSTAFSNQRAYAVIALRSY